MGYSGRAEREGEAVSTEFDVLRELALAGDVTAAESLRATAQKEIKRARCRHVWFVVADHGEPCRMRCRDCGLERNPPRDTPP